MRVSVAGVTFTNAEWKLWGQRSQCKGRGGRRAYFGGHCCLLLERQVKGEDEGSRASG